MDPNIVRHNLDLQLADWQGFLGPARMVEKGVPLGDLLLAGRRAARLVAQAAPGREMPRELVAGPDLVEKVFTAVPDECEMAAVEARLALVEGALR